MMETCAKAVLLWLNTTQENLNWYIGMARILLVTDAFSPQVNGVVTTLLNLVAQAHLNGDKISVYHPGMCSKRFSLPIYREIEIGFPNRKKAEYLVTDPKWDYIHIATPEGTIGQLFAKICRKYDVAFTASCHTKFPEFINARFPFIKTEWGWKWMRSCYRGAKKILVTTETMRQELIDRGFDQDLVVWSRGVDRDLFCAKKSAKNSNTKTLLCVSRVSHEKGLDSFCNLKISNTKKVLVGDGPYLKKLKKKYPDVEFAGKKTGSELAKHYQSADVFVFPSKADTFGVVIIESIACGTPVAAYPVTGPVDIINEGKNGALDEDLETAVKRALKVSRSSTYQSSLDWTWERCYSQFKQALLAS